MCDCLYQNADQDVYFNGRDSRVSDPVGNIFVWACFCWSSLKIAVYSILAKFFTESDLSTSFAYSEVVFLCSFLDSVSAYPFNFNKGKTLCKGCIHYLVSRQWSEWPRSNLFFFLISVGAYSFTPREPPKMSNIHGTLIFLNFCNAGSWYWDFFSASFLISNLLVPPSRICNLFTVSCSRLTFAKDPVSGILKQKWPKRPFAVLGNS